MKSKKVWFGLLVLISGNLVGQTRPKSVTLTGKDRFSTELTITDVYGRPFKNNYSDVKGSPNFIDDWLSSSVKLANDARAEELRARLDLVSQELHFRSADNEDWIFHTQFIKEVEFTDSVTGNHYKFRAGLPAIDNQKENNFYLVLSEGPVSLLKSIRKIISVNKDDISGEVEKKFETYEDYYLFSSNSIRRLKREKDFVVKVLSDKKADVDAFIKTNPLNFKNVNDILRLVNYYNSLPR